MADACLFLMNMTDEQFDFLFEQGRNNEEPSLINIGVGKDIAITKLAHIIKTIAGYEGDIKFDTTKRDGTFSASMLLAGKRQRHFKED